MMSTKSPGDHKTREVLLGEVGSLSAPPGSPQWVRAVQVELQALLDEATSDLRAIRVYLKGLVDYKGYQQLDDEFGHPFPSLRAFAQARRPWGLEYDPDLLDAIQAEPRPLTLGAYLTELRPGPGAPLGNTNAAKNNHDTIRIEPAKKHYGTSKAYRLALLKRDHPDIFDALQRGEYRSVTAAWKLATGQTPETPFAGLLRAWRKVSREDRVRFLREMLTEQERAELANELLAIETRRT